jgi:RND family efflux transporter MFP subunit
VIDRASGTIRARAVFANADNLFTPGMFARVQVPGSLPYDALLVPEAAVGTEQARKYVLALGDDNTVKQQYVTLGDVHDELRVIKSGVTATDRIVVNGLMRAKPGAKVTPQEPGASPAGPQAKNN